MLISVRNIKDLKQKHKNLIEILAENSMEDKLKGAKLGLGE